MIINDNNVDQLNITTRLLVSEALRKGYEVEFTRSTPSAKSGIVRCVKDTKELFLKSLNTVLTPSYGVFSAEDKFLTYNLLRGKNLPVPKTIVIEPSDDCTAAMELLHQAGEVVVKPVAANHGRGISIGLQTEKELLAAVNLARRTPSMQPDVIVQEMLHGKEYRFLVLNGKVLAVAHRVPPNVTGDGVHTVAELIDIKNRDPRRGVGHEAELTHIDMAAVSAVFGRSYLDIVPENGQATPLLKTSNLSQGGESIDYTDVASSEIKKIAAQAAQATHLGVAGVDIMTTDIEHASAKNSWIIEVNVSPGIRMHQFPAQGKPRDVAKQLFIAIERTARPIGKTLGHIGRVEVIRLPDIFPSDVRARIDTGATISSLWASDIQIQHDGLHCKLFGEGDINYTGDEIVFTEYSTRFVRSSNGYEEERYQIVTTISLKGRKIKARFTLADRSKQIYPVLIGRNVVRGKFIVDVSKGNPDIVAERIRGIS